MASRKGKGSVCNQSFWMWSRWGGSVCACRWAQNGINVTLGTRVSLPWWITEGITIMEIVIDWSFVSIYCSSVAQWSRTPECYHVNSATASYQCCFGNRAEPEVHCRPSVAALSPERDQGLKELLIEKMTSRSRTVVTSRRRELSEAISGCLNIDFNWLKKGTI